MKRIVLFFLCIVSLSVSAQQASINFGVKTTFYDQSLNSFFIGSGDFTGDNKKDVFLATGNIDFGNPDANQVFLFPMNQSGISSSPRVILTLPTLVEGMAYQLLGAKPIMLAGDSVSSLAFIQSDSVSVLKNDSLGWKFSTYSRFVGGNLSLIESGNFYPGFGEEVAVIDSSQYLKTFRFNGLSLDTVQRFFFPGDISRIERGKFDNDSLEELFVIWKAYLDTSYSVRIYSFNQLTNLLSVKWEFPLLSGDVYSARIGDMFNDGFNDLVLSMGPSSFGNRRMLIVNLKGDTAIAPVFSQVPLVYSSTDFVISDFNRDGFLDIVARNATGLVSFSNNQNGVFYSGVNGSYNLGSVNGGKIHSTLSFDYNNDGKSDFLVTREDGYPSGGLVLIPNTSPFVPDLRPSDLNFSSPLVNGSLVSDTLLVQIKNIGDILATNPAMIKVKVILSDSVFGQQIWQRTFFLQFDSLAKNDSILLKLAVDSMNLPIGSKLLAVASIDSSGLIEITRKNNSFSKEFAHFVMPDLTVSKITFPNSFSEWYHGPLGVKVKNLGEVISNPIGGLRLKTIVTLKQMDTVYYQRIYVNILSALLPGDSISVSIISDSLNMRVDSLLINSFIDFDSTVVESDELNNYLDLKLKLFGNLDALPDLSITQITLMNTSYTNWYEGGIRIFVKNLGTYRATSDSIRLRTSVVIKLADTIYYSKFYDNWFSSIDSGASVTAEISSDSLNMMTDSLFITSFIDYDSVITESNEENNQFVFVLKLLGPVTVSSLLQAPIFSIYPNPTKESLYLENIPVGSLIEIFSEFGQKIFSKKCINQEKLNVSEFPSGIYFLKVINPQGSTVKKFIKE